MKAESILLMIISIVIITSISTFHAPSSFANDSLKVKEVNNELQKIIDDIIKKDKEYRNCMLAVSTGDGLFNWAGAIGLADDANGIKNTVDTPFYLASITKLFTAVVIMQLYEQDKIDLDKEMQDKLWKISLDLCKDEKTTQIADSLT